MNTSETKDQWNEEDLPQDIQSQYRSAYANKESIRTYLANHNVSPMMTPEMTNEDVLDTHINYRGGNNLSWHYLFTLGPSPISSTLPINSRLEEGEESESENENEDEDEDEDKDEDETAFNQLYSRGQSLSSAPPGIIHERLEWQQMLQSVLMGEVIKSEKKRLLSTDQFQPQKPIEEIWLSLRALLRGRTIGEEQRHLQDSRKDIDKVVESVFMFKVDDTSDKCPVSQVAEILKSVDRMESLYSTRANIMEAHPSYGDPNFQSRLDALNSWYTITRSLQMQLKILRNWTGSEDLQITRKPLNTNDASSSVASYLPKGRPNDPSFLERILKESALQDTFDKRTLSALSSLLKKSKQTMIENSGVFQEMNMPPFISQLRQLSHFPTLLVKEALKLRLEYKDKLTEIPTQMVDTMMDDYRGLLSLACMVKHKYEKLISPAPGWEFKDTEHIEKSYSDVLMNSLRFYFKLVAWKMDIEKENSLRICDFLEKEWDFLMSTVCRLVDEAFNECAEHFCYLTNRQLMSVMQDYMANLKDPLETIENDIESGYTKILHTMRMRARKLLQFAKFFMNQFENSTEYLVDSDSADKFIECLVSSGHFLVYTGSFEEERIYIIASPSLRGCEERIKPILYSTFAYEKTLNTSSFSGVPGVLGQHEDYLVLFSPWNNIVWTGEMIQMDIPSIPVGLKSKRARLVVRNSQFLPIAKNAFSATVQSSKIQVLQEQKAHKPKISNELSKIKSTVYRLSEVVISSVHTIREKTLMLGCQELVEECFSFASDFGVRSSKFLDLSPRFHLDLKLVHLASDWICFIIDDCVPTNRKTFRWAVAALEFGHFMTRGASILSLNEKEFFTLQSKVAHCIALLISHFDVLGTPWTHELKEEQQRKRGTFSKRTSYGVNKRTENKETIASCIFGSSNDNAVLANSVIYIRDAWMQRIIELEKTRSKSEQKSKLVGKVLDDQKPEDQSLVFLAPSSSNLSFRWQQGRFIGAGTFGSVYLAINLDTSSVMAVKEIRFPDSSSLSALHKAIKEEMKVMEMLNHKNIVQYYGMEVHRDKVFIFMEYCENGSLGALLDHGGRIEDEFYIVSYAHQLLSGLAYLHDNNVVHRDIKPDNILIDHQGQLKLTDFGASKILAKGQKTMGKSTLNMNANSPTGTPMYMAPEVITGGDTGRKGSMDIWSLGCCIVQMSTGRRPWSTLENEWSVMYHVVTGHPPLPDPSQLSALGIDFLKKCFTRNPNKRPSAHELISHPWITDYLNEINEEEVDRLDDNYSASICGRSIPISVDLFERQPSDSGIPHNYKGIPSFSEQPMVRSILNTMSSGPIGGSDMSRKDAQSYFTMLEGARGRDPLDEDIQDEQTLDFNVPITPLIRSANSSIASMPRSINEDTVRSLENNDNDDILNGSLLSA
ncbi:hypothetical protein BDF14DRAFT_1749213 [Spinellus fusiger]|nr:hypothetical protein BDF14DRAFT_1749213 [Spinellus fusiger]